MLAMRVNLPLQGFPAGARLAFYDEVRQRALAMPGVQSVAFSSRVPLADAVPTSEVKLAGSPGPGVRSLMHSAGPGLFETIGARIVEGREISAQDRSNRPVVVINEILAARLFENRSALGQKVSVGHWTGPVEAEVVGVARPVRYNGLAGSVVPEAYLDYSAAMQPLTLFVRTSEPADRIVPMLKAGVREQIGKASHESGSIRGWQGGRGGKAFRRRRPDQVARGRDPEADRPERSGAVTRMPSFGAEELQQVGTVPPPKLLRINAQ
jgi:hypothetical protein